MPALGSLLLLSATVLIFHAAFSTFEHLSHFKALGQPETPVPTDIAIEALLGLILGIVGASFNAPPLKEITWASEMKTRSIDEMDARPGFGNYNNRGKNIFSGPTKEGKR